MDNDLQKFENFLNEMNIGYTISEYPATDERLIYINDNFLEPNYGAELRICFNGNNEFIKFETWGE